MKNLIYVIVGAVIGTMIALSIGLASFETSDLNVVLTPENSVVLRGDVNDESVDKVSRKLLKLSQDSAEGTILYLVIDSGGGSILAGIDLIALIDSIPNPIHTITIYSYSMAYSISQRGDLRLITKFGITGQHRPSGTFKGQFADGEVESRLGFITSIVDSLESYEASRMGLTLEKFKELIKDESYFFGKAAVDSSVSDALVVITCSKELTNQIDEDYFSGCPLLRNSSKGRIEPEERD